MRAARFSVIVIGMALIMIIGFSVQPVQRDQPANASQPAVFDHSGCQYPDRSTNPVNGCDNSDPCDPSNVKGGSGECAPIPQPAADLTAAPAVPEYIETIIIEGK